jgi:general secretion pathway protein J
MTGSRTTPAREAAFTLIELLVALTIFAVLAGFAYRGLQSMLDNREALQKETRKWRDIALFVGRIDRDFSAVIALPPSGGINRRMAPVTQAVPALGTSGVALIRSGSVLQENVLASPQRIAWRLNGSTIERLTWSSVDASPREEPNVVPILASVSALDFRFLDTNGEWRRNWNGSPTPVPAAIEVTVKLASGESIVRLVDMTTGATL